MAEGYAIRGGEAGKRRLDVIAAMAWPATRAVLERADVAPEADCLDVGCGGGHVTIELARMAAAGRTRGVDVDAGVIALARADAATAGVTNVVFEVGDARSPGNGPYDVVYARFLLSHLPCAADVVRELVGRLRPGGVLVIGDIDHQAFSRPRSAAYEEYDALYTELIRRRGGDPEIGFSLPGMLQDAGLSGIDTDVAQPVFLSGPAKRIHCTTLENVIPAAVAENLVTEQDAADLLARMEAVTAEPRTLVAMPRIVHAWGRTPGR